ncbi:hypothetical protein ACEQ6A_35760, partial [Rhizobium brockwellii]|uniref:hypothetical protein n=1 Tax=Rhizobium brockwellii TaxID=3019932 RepID=UPI003F9D174E
REPVGKKKGDTQALFGARRGHAQIFNQSDAIVQTFVVKSLYVPDHHISNKQARHDALQRTQSLAACTDRA